MLKSLGTLVALGVICAFSTYSVSAQTTRYVRSGGDDTANDCNIAGSPCATILHALDEADSGDTIDVGTGTFVGALLLDEPVTLLCSRSDEDPVSRVGDETVIQPDTGETEIIQIRASNVTVNGCDLDGDNNDAWTGVKIWNPGSATSPEDISGIVISHNRIHDLDEANPASPFNYAYGIWAIGGGQSESAIGQGDGIRGAISGLEIEDNRITSIGAVPVPAAAAKSATAGVAGAGIYLKSISGAVGAGASITGNTLDVIYSGSPGIATTLAGGTTEYGLGIAVLQDSDTSSNDSGAEISGNTLDAAGGSNGPYLGVVISTSASLVSEDIDDFGTDVVPLIINLAHPKFGGQPMATIDTAELSTGSTPVFAVDGLNLSTAAGVPTSVGYFRTLAAAGALASGSASPQSQNGTVDGLTLTVVGGTTLRFTYANGDSFDVLITDYTGNGFTPSILGGSGDDEITVDADVLEFTDLTVNLDGGEDLLTIGTYGGDCAPLTQIRHSPSSATDGAITFQGTAAGGCAGFTNDLTYLGLEPIDDSGNFPVSRVFDFDAGAETIVLRDDDVDGDLTDDSNNNVSFIDSELVESYTFGNPTASLTINALGGDDTLNIGLLDTAAGVLPDIDIIVNGDSGADTFNVTPAPDTDGYDSFTINGGSPGTCPGDVLNLVTTETPDFSTAGTVGWGTSSTLADFAYTGIEAIANLEADVAIATSGPVFPGDQVDITITVTNAGSDPAQCLTIENVLATGLTFVSGPTLSTGSLSGSDWVIGSLVANGTATLTGTVRVNTSTAVDLTLTTSTTDNNLNDNSTALIGQMFRYPDGAYAQTALAYDYSFGGETLERVILGLYQGGPTLDSALLCRIPQQNGGAVYTVSDGETSGRWRECGAGLPYPLHVNDLYYDSSTDRIWLSSWGWDGLYYSDDGGYSFTGAQPVLPTDPQTPPGSRWTNVYSIEKGVGDIFYISADNGLVFRSLNGGTTWQSVSSLPGGSSDTPWSLVSHPTASGVLFAGTAGHGVYYTDDFALSWQPLDPVTTTNGIFDSLVSEDAGWVFDLEFSPDAVCPVDITATGTNCTLFAGTGEGLWYIQFEINGTTGANENDWNDAGFEVTLDDASDVVPEVRGLAFENTAAGDDALYLTTWGSFVNLPTPYASGVWKLDNPHASPTDIDFFLLRGHTATFLVPTPSGHVLVGSEGLGVIPMDAVSATAVTPTDNDVPTSYTLHQNYPNPFNPRTAIGFDIPRSEHVTLRLFDGLGREVDVLADGVFPAGRHLIQYDASQLPSGLYLYSLATPAGSLVRQMILLR